LPKRALDHSPIAGAISPSLNPKVLTGLGTTEAKK
jgi:hypothetical protein